MTLATSKFRAGDKLLVNWLDWEYAEYHSF